MTTLSGLMHHPYKIYAYTLSLMYDCDVTTLQNLCIYINSAILRSLSTDVTTLQNLCIYIRLMLFSCFNLAGCNPIHRETREQSRQVRRRRFGIIRPYFVIH